LAEGLERKKGLVIHLDAWMEQQRSIWMDHYYYQWLVIHFHLDAWTEHQRLTSMEHYYYQWSVLHFDAWMDNQVSITTAGVETTPNIHADMPLSWERYASIITSPTRCPNYVVPQIA
jgi:hypothetical protein